MAGIGPFDRKGYSDDARGVLTDNAFFSWDVVAEDDICPWVVVDRRYKDEQNTG